MTVHQNCPRFTRIAWLVLGLSLGACSQDSPVAEPPDEANGRAKITNSSATLGARVTVLSENVAVGSDGGGKSGKAGKASSVSLTLVASVEPPVVDGFPVQATVVDLHDASKSIVSYNTRGEPFRGAIDVFTSSNKGVPELASSVSFNDTDISAVTVSGSDLYAAEASGNGAFSTPAALEQIRLNGSKMTLTDNARLGLGSFAGTGVTVIGNSLFATSGNTGGLTRVDRSSFSSTASIALDDARWVAEDSAGKRIVVAQGTPGRISTFDADTLAALNTFSFPGADVPEAKTTVEVVGGKAFIAAGSEGVQIMDLDTGTIVGSVPVPDAQALGLDPSVVVTNAVAIDRHLMFIANGEAGVYLVEADQDFSRTAAGELPGMTAAAQLQFGEAQSANHVGLRGNYLFVAAGAGGLKIVELAD